MSILSNLSSKKRTFEVAEPDRKYLAQGIFFIALGTILISCITVTELTKLSCSEKIVEVDYDSIPDEPISACAMERWMKRK